jgi:hypothetical protein
MELRILSLLGFNVWLGFGAIDVVFSNGVD